MTKLRDDGFLETDDCVVAACFLGRRARSGRYGIWPKTPPSAMIIDRVLATRVYAPLGRYSYPILIRASVVRKVWNGGIAAEVLHYAVCKEGRERALRIDVVRNWLRTHTK